MNIFDHIPKPSEIGADEYRQIYDCLDFAECVNNPEFAMAVCEEFKTHAQSIIDKLEAAVLERSARGE